MSDVSCASTLSDLLIKVKSLDKETLCLCLAISIKLQRGPDWSYRYQTAFFLGWLLQGPILEWGLAISASSPVIIKTIFPFFQTASTIQGQVWSYYLRGSQCSLTWPCHPPSLHPVDTRLLVPIWLGLIFICSQILVLSYLGDYYPAYNGCSKYATIIIY